MILPKIAKLTDHLFLFKMGTKNAEIHSILFDENTLILDVKKGQPFRATRLINCFRT